MPKQFNVTADCKPDIHYMVSIEKQLSEIKTLIDEGKYFTMNRARQYGKTTTLRALGNYLRDEYYIVLMDFQTFGDAKFKNENTFALSFASSFLRLFRRNKLPITEKLESTMLRLKKDVDDRRQDFEQKELFEELSDICEAADKKIVLMIDEVDSATNNQVFMDFLGQLRAYYIDRDIQPTFQSVILAGVYDVKNLRRKIRSDEDHKVNSPWITRENNEENGSLLPFDECTRDHKELAPYDIAADFLVDMSFSVQDIAGMIEDYEDDYRTGMDITEMAGLLYDYTSGYPFLVSRICKLLDERITGTKEFPNQSSAWTKEGFLSAIRILLAEPNTLFESLINKLEDYPELDEMLRNLLFKGKEIVYVIGVRSIEMALMFGFVKISGSQVLIANRIFETLLYNFFLAAPEMQREEIYDAALRDKNQFIKNGHLDMKRILERFVLHFDELYGERGDKFYEEDGRRYFMLYLRPIINGTGNYYAEAETRNRERTDLIVDYQGEQFIIEVKIWYGNAYHTRGEKQLSNYLDYYHLKKGYMLSFNFNKTKEIGVKEIILGDRVLVEAVV